jgi:vitamin B12 transporter
MRVFCGSLLFGIGWLGLACTAAVSDEGMLSQVVVSATRIPTPADQIASSVTVITADEIAARQERTFADVLKDVPGLNVVQTGGPGGTTSVFMRGTNSNHTKVFIDGIDVGDPSKFHRRLRLRATADAGHR